MQLRIEASFEVLGGVYNVLQKFGVAPEQEEYGQEDGGASAVVLTVQADDAVANELCEAIANATSGKVVPVITDP